MTNPKQTPNVPPLAAKPSGYEPTDIERHLMLSYHYCAMSCDHATLSEPVLQALFCAGVTEYFAVMSQKKWRGLQERLFAYLGSNETDEFSRGLQVHLRDHSGPPSDLISTFEFFKAVRDKGIAHKDPDREKFFTLEETELWIKVPVHPPALAEHPLYKASHFKIGGVQHVPDYLRRAMCELVGVTLQILWQRPQIISP